MICLPGKCIQCGKGFTLPDGRIASNYSHVTYELENGSRLEVALCADCNITEDQWPEVIRANDEAFESQGSDYRIDQKIVREVERIPYLDLLKRAQFQRCPSCSQPLGVSFIHTNGLLIHEHCPVPIPEVVNNQVQYTPQEEAPIKPGDPSV